MNIRPVFQRLAVATLFVLAGATAASPAAANNLDSTDTVLIPGDFNGDGRTDFFVQATHPQGLDEILLTDVTGAPGTVMQSWENGYLGIRWDATSVKIYVGDFNGDGHADLLVQSLNSDQAWLLLQDTSNPNQPFDAITATFSTATYGYSWSAVDHNLVIGDFNGDGKADVFMQAAYPSGWDVVLTSTGSGFTVGQTWQDGYLGLQWSQAGAVISAGDFNGDGNCDLFVQGLPTIIIIAATPVFPISLDRPNSFAIVDGTSTGQFPAITQSWSRYDFGVDWSPTTHQAIIGDFNGDGRQDILLQDIGESSPSWLMTASSTGTFGTIAQTWNNGNAGMNWSLGYNKLIAGDFNGDGTTDLYIQMPSSTKSNAVATFSNSTPTVTQLAVPNPGAASSPNDSGSGGSGGSGGSNNSNVVGTIPGQFSVDPSGAATYKIAIQVPPGVHGMQPDLAILYNSHAGNGDLGVGWSLSGLSLIKRCGQDLEDDGQWLAPSLQATDRFCMDGQRLVPTPPGSPTNYWSGTAYEYRTKFASVQRVVANGTSGNGPASFTVYDKTAMKRSYGTTTTELGADGRTVLMWPIDEIDDPFGNYIKYSYTLAGGTATNEYLLSEIDYSNNKGVQVGKVVFNYQSGSRNDDEYVVTATTGVSVTSLLQSIQVYGPGGQLVRQYSLSYQVSTRTGRNLLQMVQECDPDNNCVAPTTFTYPRSANVTAIDTGTPPPDTVGVDTTQPGSWKTLDLDGDGLADYVYVNADDTVHVILGKDLFTDIPTGIPAGRNGLTNALRLNWGAVADFYGTGQQELLAPSVTGQGGCGATPDYYELLAWKNGKLVVDPSYELIGPNGVPPNEYQGNIPVAVDVEGKGLPSVFTKYGQCGDNNNGEVLWYWHNNGHGWDDGHGNAAPAQTTISFGDGDNAIQPINYTGKGFNEFYIKHCGTNQTVCQPGGIYSWNTSNNTLQSIGYDLYNFSATNPVFLDYNGDGLTDAVIPLDGQWCFFLNNGNGWSPNPYQPPVYPQCVSLDTRQANQAVVLDYFSNGHQDLVVPVQNASGAQYWWVVPVDPLSGAPGTLVDTGIYFDGNINDYFGDANGDGLPDYFSTTDSGKELSIGYNTNTAPELLGEIQSTSSSGQSLGSTTVISYLPLPLANAAGWTTGAAAAADIGIAPQYRPYMGPVPLVVESYVDSGLGSGNNTQWLYTYYRYGGAEMDAWGRGFVGFSDLQTVNENTGILTESTFSQALLTAGMVLSTAQYQIPASELSVITNPITTTTGTHCSWVSEKEDNGKSIRERECDYGNAGYSGFTPFTGLKLLSQTVNAEPTVLNLSQGGTFAYSATSTASSYDLASGALYKQVVTKPTYVIDPSGNDPQTTEVKVETTTPAGDDYLVDTNNIKYYGYSAGTSDWCVLGRVQSSTVQDTWLGAAAGSIQAASGAHSPGHTATFNYTNCEVTEEDSVVLDQSGNTLSTLTKTYALDRYGNTKSATVTGTNTDGTPLPSRTSSTVYDVYGLYPASTTNVLGQTSSSTWDYRFGLATSTTDANGLTTSTTYDSFGRKATAQGILPAQQTSWSYDWCGVSANCLSPNAVYAYTQLVNSEVQPGTMIPSSVTEYDRLGRAVFATQFGLYGVPSYQATYYDSLSRQYLTSQPYQSGDAVCWDYKTFDVLSRVTIDYLPLNTTECQGQGAGVIAPGGTPPSYTRNTTYTYSGLTTTTKHVQETTVSTLNALGKVASFTDGNGKTTQYGYDFWGNTSEVLDATGQNKTLVTSDSAGDKLSMTDPDMGSWTYTYNALSELVTQLDPNEAVNHQAATVLKYDLLGRLIERDEPEGVSTWKYDIAYGAGIGKLAYETGPNGYWEGYAYDGFGEVSDKITLANSQEYWVSTTYDDFGQVAQVVYPNLTAVSVSGSTAPGAPATLSVVMDANNAQVDASWPNTANGVIYHLLRASGANVAFSASSATEIYVGPDASFADSQVVDGPYTYYVETCNGNVCSNPANVSASLTVALAPPVPSAPVVAAANGVVCGIQVADTHQTSINLCWPVTSPGSDHYRVIESSNGGAYSGTIWDGTASSGNATTVTATVSLSGDATYLFEVIACDSTDTICSVPGAASSPYVTYLQPSAPQSVTPSTSTFSGPPATYTIRWTAPASGSSVTYKLFETFVNQGTGTQKQISLPNPRATTSPSITQTVTGTYLYQLQACDVVETTVCGPFATTTVTINNPSPPPVPTLTVPTVALDGVVFNVSWSDTGTVNSYSLYEYYFFTESDKGLLTSVSGGSGYTSQSVTMGNEYKSMSFVVVACSTNGGCSTSATYTVTNTDNTAGGPNNCPKCIVMPDPRYDGSWQGSFFGSVQPKKVSPSNLIASAVIPQLRMDRLSIAGREYAPMPKAGKIHRRAVRAYEAEDRIAAVNPTISAYPPLRHDNRIWAHYAARGGIAGGWTERAGCDGSSNCSEAPGSFALMVGYSYDAYGHEVSVTRLDENGNPQYNYWLAMSANAHAQVTQEGLQLDAENVSMGVGVSRSYDLATGLVNCIDATVKSPQATCGAVTGALQSDSYGWDAYGNLISRASAVTGLSETFGYDADNRLDSISTLHNGTVAASDTPTYMDTAQGGTPGDIYKRAGATYSYPIPGSALPHAVSGITLPGGGTRSFVYDADGNLTSETGDINRTLTWYSYNKPNTISSTSTGNNDSFFYSPDRNRYERVSQVNGDTVTTIYIAGLFEAQSDQSTGVTTYRNYVMAGGAIAAVDNFQGVSGSSATETVSYYLYDHLGEVEATVSGSGTNLVQYSYDAWGKARATSGANAFVSAAWGSCSPTLPGQHAGYGTHENLDDQCLVHMEGRVYDPDTGRFVSADPTMQDPISTQGYDRYGYIQNNPLSGVDPDGYHFHDIAGPVEGILMAFSEECAYCAAAAIALAAIDGYQQTGSYKGAALDAGEAYVMYEIGEQYPDSYGVTDPQFWEKAALEGLAGGAFSKAGGGRFGDGFLGGFAGSVAGNYIDPGDYGFIDTARAVTEAYIVGGTASALGGGSFSNGGATAAFVELFNDLKHDYEVRARAVLKIKPIDGQIATKDPSTGTADGRFSEEGAYRTDSNGNPRPHRGDDINADEGTPIYAPADGRAIVRTGVSGFGNEVEIYHADGVVTRYGHLDKVNVADGDHVTAGEEIGTVGRSGRDGEGGLTHLHIEVIVNNMHVDPAKVFDWKQ